MIKALLCSLAIFACSPSYEQKNTKQEVRVTYYWPDDSGQIGTITSTGRRAKHLKTCAVDPALFPYGTKIKIEEMGLSLDANDTGSWVIQKKAALKNGKDVPVIDIFVRSRSEANRLARKYPMFMDIQVYHDKINKTKKDISTQ